MSDRFEINYVYDILGLKPGASVDEVKQAYRQMAKIWHPLEK
jgi:DnaJ-class molecular chaperone